MTPEKKAPSPFLKVTAAGGLKSIDFSPWGGIEGFLSATSGSASQATKLKAVVPQLARAVDMTASAVSGLPFELMDGDNVVDKSSDWQNAKGGIPNPQKLLYLLAASLCGGAAYALPTYAGETLVDLQYCAPQTVTPEIDRDTVKFIRDGKPLTADEIIYLWLPDSDVELGPALTHPLGNSALAAGLMASMSGTLKTYGDRGFIPATIFAAEGSFREGDKEKAEDWLNKFLRGWSNVVAKIVNNKFTINKIGAGMEELKGVYSELTREQKEDIAVAFGIPAGIFLTNAAFASEFDALIRLWYTSGRFKGIYQTIEEGLTDQLFFPKFGLRWRFRPETLDAFQDGNKNQIEQMAILSGMGIENSVAARVAGVNLPDGIKYDDLNKSVAAPVATPAKEDADETIDGETEVLDAPQLPEKTLTLTAAETKDLALWQQMAVRFWEKKKPLPVDFECKALPETVAAPIRQKLMVANSAHEVERAFDLGGDERTEPQVITALYLAVKALEVK